MSWEKYRKIQDIFVPIEKEFRKVGKDCNDHIATVPYKMKFIDGTRFMAISLPIIIGNITEGIFKIKCKDCNFFLEYESVNDSLIKYKCL